MDAGSKKYRVACLYLFGNGASVHALAEACYRFTPQLAVRTSSVKDSAHAIFLEIGSCHRLYSEQLLKMKLTTLAKRFGWLSQITFGDSAGEAFALARHPSYCYMQDLPLEALTDILTPFKSDTDSEKIIFKTIQILKTLGLKNVGEFATLPPRTLASRFGKEAVELSARIRKQAEMAWPGFHPSPGVTEKAPIENSENLEALGFVLKTLVDRVVARLHGRSERVSIIQVNLELVKWGRRLNAGTSDAKAIVREFRLELPLAQSSTRGLFPILQEHLSACLQREPLTAPVDSLEIKVLEAVPSRGAQRDFFSRKEEESEVWDALVARLSLKIGAGKVYTAVPVKRYCPEKAYKKSIQKLPAENYVSPKWPHRPTRILRHPQRISTQSGPFGLSRPNWTVIEGPERLSGEWWDSSYEGFFRDYYRVQVASGEELWVFINRKSPQIGLEPVYYLHGYFD